MQIDFLISSTLHLKYILSVQSLYSISFWVLVPKNILTAIDPAIANLKPSLKQKDDEYGNFLAYYQRLSLSKQPRVTVVEGTFVGMKGVRRCCG